MNSNEMHITEIMSFKFLFICFGFFQGNYCTLLVYQLMEDRLGKDYDETSSLLQPILLFAGSILGGILLMFGRRKCALLIDAPIMVAGIMSLFMSHGCLFIARMINDFARGGLLIIYLIYFKEMMPKRYAGLTVCIMLFVASFCMVVITALDVMFRKMELGVYEDEKGHSQFIARLLVFIGVIMCQTHVATGLFYLQGESPRYLMEAQRKEEAYAIISLIYQNQDSAKDEIDFIQEASEFRQFTAVTWSTLCSSKSRRALIICCVLMFLRYATGMLSFWSFLKVESMEGLSILLGIYALHCVALLVAGFVLEYLNLRICVLAGLAFSTVVNALALVFGCDPDDSTRYYLAVGFAVASSVCAQLTVSPISCILSLQLMPDKGTALATVFTWMSMFLVLLPYTFPNQPVKPYYYMQPIYIVASVLGFVFCLFSLKDTKGTDESTLKNAYLASRY